MKNVTKAVIILLIGIIGLTAAAQNSQASELCFWLNAWNVEDPIWIAANGVVFRIDFLDQFGWNVGDPIQPMLSTTYGSLYWIYVDEFEFGPGGDYENAVAWKVTFVGGNWNLVNPPGDPWIITEGIGFNNPCELEDWEFTPGQGR